MNTKYKVGDRVLIEVQICEVTESDCHRPYKVRGIRSHIWWPDPEDIKGLAPKPREFKPGDTVTPTRGPLTGQCLLIVAVDSGFAWLRGVDSFQIVLSLTSLQHVD